MQFFSFFSVLFGLTIIMNPNMLAYLIGGFFVFAGLAPLIATHVMKTHTKNGAESWKVGNYEILKKK